MPDTTQGAAARQAEAERLEAELAALNAELGRMRARQEHLQRPSTLVTETLRHRVAGWVDRLRARLGRR
jgi:FtsZ-binding cell division protein ZapB